MNADVWHIAQASVIGASHLANQTECQDRLLCRTVETAADGAVLIAAVADGAGSTTDGQRGAELACRLFAHEVADFLKLKNSSVKSLTAEFGKFWIEYFRREISVIAGKDGKNLREYATTFVGAVVGANCAAFFQIGDGGIVVSNSGVAGSYRFAVAPADAVYVNMTDFLTDDAAAENLRVEKIEESLTDVILFSDGIYSVAVNFQNNQPHEPFLMPMLAPLKNNSAADGLNEKLASFLNSPKINEKTDDDKTIILASRTAGKARAPSVSPGLIDSANV